LLYYKQLQADKDAALSVLRADVDALNEQVQQRQPQKLLQKIHNHVKILQNVMLNEL
jgi:hypothetical protein